MPVPFALVGDLSHELERIANHNGLSGKVKEQRSQEHIRKWFGDHHGVIHAEDSDPTALLSTLLPASRPDRVYSLQAPKLNIKLASCLGITKREKDRLKLWGRPGLPSFAERVEEMMDDRRDRITSGPAVTAEEIDRCLDRLGSQSRFSGPNLRTGIKDATLEKDLAILYRRLAPRDAKRLTRVILKELAPTVLDMWTVLFNLNNVLPTALKIRADFEAAVSCLQDMKLWGPAANANEDRFNPIKSKPCVQSSEHGLVVPPS